MDTPPTTHEPAPPGEPTIASVREQRTAAQHLVYATARCIESTVRTFAADVLISREDAQELLTRLDTLWGALDDSVELLPTRADLHARLLRAYPLRSVSIEPCEPPNPRGDMESF